jgi:hypothetical protein
MKKQIDRHKAIAVLVRLKEPIYDKVRDLAEKDRRSVANVVSIAVEKFLEKAS